MGRYTTAKSLNRLPATGSRGTDRIGLKPVILDFGTAPFTRIVVTAGVNESADPLQASLFCLQRVVFNPHPRRTGWNARVSRITPRLRFYQVPTVRRLHAGLLLYHPRSLPRSPPGRSHPKACFWVVFLR